MEDENNTYPLLDLSQIDMLLEAGDDESLELVNEILELYEVECQSKLSELQSAKSNSDVSAFADAAHAIAGSSANIGGTVIWQKAKRMEDHCKSGDPMDAFSMLDEVQRDFSDTLVQLKAYLVNRQTG